MTNQRHQPSKFTPEDAEQSVARDIKYALTAGAVAVAALVSFAHIADRLDGKEPTSSLEEVQKNLGVNPQSAPAITPELPQPGQMPDVVMNGIPEQTIAVPTPDKQA